MEGVFSSMCTAIDTTWSSVWLKNTHFISKNLPSQNEGDNIPHLPTMRKFHHHKDHEISKFSADFWELPAFPGGHEMSFAANYLGHFLLCKLLLEERGKTRKVVHGFLGNPKTFHKNRWNEHHSSQLEKSPKSAKGIQKIPLGVGCHEISHSQMLVLVGNWTLSVGHRT